MSTSTIFRRPNLVEVTDWLTGLTFSRLKLYQYSGILYRCLVTHVAGPTFDSSKFEALSGIAEAAIDGKQYVRKDGAWVEVVIPAADQVSIDVTANTNGITLGNVVELVSTGGQNVQNIYHCEAPTIGSLLTLDGTNNVDALNLRSLSSTTAACYSRLSGSGVPYLRLITSGNPPTQSLTTAVSTNGATATDLSMDVLTSNTVALTYGTIAATNGYTRIATFNSTNITFSTESTAFSRSSTVQTATCALTPSNWFVACADTNADCQVYGCASNGTNAPNVSASARNVNGTNNCAYLSLARLDNDNAMLVMQNTSASNGVMCRLHSEGASNDPSASTLAFLDGTNNCTHITQSPIDSNHTLCAYNNATTSNGMLAVIQANGTNAPTVVSRSVFALSAVTYCSLTSHSATLHSLLFTDSNSDGQHLAINVDMNYNLTWSQQSTLNGATNCAYNAVAALTTTTAIGAWQEGAGSDGKAGTLTLTPTPVISGQLLGIAETSATNGAAATVNIGPVVSGTFTSGADYYAAGAGGLTVTPTPVHVLKAKSTTEGVLELRGAPEAGKQNVWEIITPGAFTWTAPETGEYEIILVGAGGSGASADVTQANGGNSGNVVLLNRCLSLGASISGSLGAGGASQTNNNTSGIAGGASIISSPFVFSATGGRGGVYIGGYNGSGAAPNPPNNQDICSIGCGCGGTANNGNFNGVAPYIGGIANTTAAIAGSRGSGGTGGVSTSGKGGDGVVRITLIHGS